jgi:hypothetical protein
MTFTAMHPTYMAPLGHAQQQFSSPQFGQQFAQQLPQAGQQQVSPFGSLAQQEEPIFPQELMLNPLGFWNKVARHGIRHGAPAVRQILDAVQYQQGVAQQVPVQMIGQQQAGSYGFLAPEEQILPQEHLVSPVTFWAKVARIGLRLGTPVARQILENVLLQQQLTLVPNHIQPMPLQNQQPPVHPQQMAPLNLQQHMPQVGQQFGQAGQQFGQPGQFGQGMPNPYVQLNHGLHQQIPVPVGAGF